MSKTPHLTSAFHCSGSLGGWKLVLHRVLVRSDVGERPLNKTRLVTPAMKKHVIRLWKTDDIMDVFFVLSLVLSCT